MNILSRHEHAPADWRGDSGPSIGQLCLAVAVPRGGHPVIHVPLWPNMNARFPINHPSNNFKVS